MVTIIPPTHPAPLHKVIGETGSPAGYFIPQTIIKHKVNIGGALTVVDISPEDSPVLYNLIDSFMHNDETSSQVHILQIFYETFLILFQGKNTKDRYSQFYFVGEILLALLLYLWEDLILFLTRSLPWGADWTLPARPGRG